MATSDKQQDTTTSNNAQGKNTKNTKKKWSLKKKIIVILSAIVVFIIAIVIVANVATSAPLKVSDELVADIQATNSTAAYDLMSADAQNAESSKDFKAAIEQIGPILTGKPDMQSKEVSAETGTNPTAKVIYKIAGNDGNTYKFTVNLVQDNGEWKVLNFESKKQ